MKTPEMFTRYIDSVCGYVRWKKARPVIAAELECHMLDQRDAYIRCGMEREQAEELTVKSMGDTAAVGGQLDAAYRPKTDWRLIATALAINIVGLAVYFIRIPAFELIRGGIHALARSPIQFWMSCLIGWLCLTAAYFSDFTRLQRAAKYIFVGLAAVSAVVWVMPDSRYWLSFEGYIRVLYRFKSWFRHIPVLFPMLFAAMLCSFRGKGEKGLAAACGLMAVQIMCCAMVGSADNVVISCVPSLILTSAAVAMGWFGNNRDIQWVVLGAVAAICVVAFVILRRLIPPEETWGSMYNDTVVKTAIREILSHARVIGQGGELGYDLPIILINSNADHIVTYLIYRYGWICLAAILSAYALFFVHGFRLCVRQNSSMGKFMSFAALLTMFIETALYITNDIGLTVFAVSLPLFSYANILTVVFMTQLGIILSVNRTGGLVCDVM